MSKEELKVEIEEEVIVEEEVNPTVEKATSQGWRPEEEWEGDPDQWIDAKTFVRNGEFMSRIQDQTKRLNNRDAEIDQLKAAMKSLGDHNKKIAEQEYNKAIRDLKKEKIVALEDDDHAAVLEIDDKIDELKEAKQEAKQAEVVEDHPVNSSEVAPTPEFDDWVSKNAWYKKDSALRGAADAIGMEYVDNNKGVPVDVMLEYVSKKMKDEFPHKFGNPNQGKPSSVTETKGASKRVKKSKYTEKDLSEEQRGFAKMFVETGAFDTMQEYVDQLVESGDL